MSSTAETRPPARRPWWRKKRWIAAAVLAAALAYPLSLWPACWIALRLDPGRDSRELQFICRVYAPMLRLVAESPRGLRNLVFRTIEFGAPRDGSFLRTRDHVIVWVNHEYGLTLLSFP